MQRKIIALACAAIGAGFSINAVAQTPGAFDTPEVKVILSGATAPDNFLVTIATGLFEAGFHRYQDNAGTPTTYTDDGRGHNAFFGRVKNDATIPASLRGRTVLFVKRSRGGSVWGVNPVARGQRIETLDITSTSCVLDSGIYRCNVKGIDPGLPGYTASTNAGEPSDFGVSDVEPAMFKGPYNVEFGQAQLSNVEVARMDVKPVNVLTMGIVATNGVPATTMLSRAAYGAMLSGNYTDWSQVDPSLSSGNTNVVVCRRVQGSGTQTSYNWYFNNFPCQAAAAGTVAPTRMSDSAGYRTSGTGTQADPFIIDPTQGYTVVENPGSGNVRDCLKAANGNTAHNFRGDDGFYYRVKFDNTPGTPFRAIGVLSADSASSANPDGNGWSFRYLDGAGVFNINTQANAGGSADKGIAPSKANLISGAYDFAVELTMQYRKVAVTNDHGDSIAALSGLKRDFANEFIKRAGDPAFNTNNWVAALPPTFDPSSSPNVAKGSRFGNTCSPLQLLY
jgi:hypothetical protein